ncbi:cation diffusion facilitator family transporter [Metaclostridioides mangenotii]|uniref:Cation diffusion facilitator family transporter n=1 Tax=Metaclostridioides mangenotii TaxID=1540 RepID=A0ABS4ECZ9_9FIRM|nr:cation diffusion facilitator family transporter [Clostridioides mangenotii]MBP1855824.1 cation diffusion facilitator family transporter [Clostridioides mangenotii]
MVSDNYKKVNQVLSIILFANLGVALIKIIVGSSVKSASMTADGFHSLSDGTSNIIGLIAIFFASKPKDESHPYGHKKIEAIASLIIGIMLLFIAIKIILTAFYNLQNPVELSINALSLIVMVVTLAINIFVSTYEYRVGKELNSQILMSDSIHTKSDIFISIGVLFTLLGVRLGLPSIVDPIVSLAVSGFIINSSYEVLKSSIGILIDRAAVDKSMIKELVFEFNEVKDVHNIRSRGSKNDLHIDMHIMVEPFISVEESHKLAHRIEKEIKTEINTNTQVIVHIEPFYKL